METENQELQSCYDEEIHKNGELRDQISTLEDENHKLSDKISALKLGTKADMNILFDKNEQIAQLQKELSSVNAKFSEVEDSYNKIKELERERNNSVIILVIAVITFALLLITKFEPKNKKGVKTEEFKKELQETRMQLEVEKQKVSKLENDLKKRDKKKSPPKENGKNIFKVLSRILEKDIKENDKVPIGALAKALIELKMFMKGDENKLIIEIVEICEKISYLTGTEPGNSDEKEIKFTTNMYNRLVPELLDKMKIVK
ncbi:MAG: hypothetical protein ABH828_02455 [archaeon]